MALNRKHDFENGFTLLEVMVAVALLAGVCITVLTGFNYQAEAARTGNERFEAAIVGREVLEEIRLKGSPAPGSPAEGSIGNFSWKVESGASGLPGVERLTIDVRWGSNGRLQLVSYVAAK